MDDRGEASERCERARRVRLHTGSGREPHQVVQSGAIAATQTYTYDANDRLLSVCFQAGACPGGADPFIRWTYDKVGNRLTEARPGVAAVNYVYNGLDQLTQAGSTAYTYDKNGNETAAGSRTFAYDLANRLKSTTSGSTTTTYSYDGDGARLQASTGTQASKKTNFLWDTSFGLPQLALERDGNNGLLRRYTYGSGRVSMFTGGASYYYHHDALGSMRNLTNSSGVTQWTDTYEPYGQVRTETKNSTSAPANLMKFTGEYLDPTGLYHLRARQYDAATGRFVAGDPADQTIGGAEISGYVYVAARPTRFVDPSGLTFQPVGEASMAAAEASSFIDCLGNSAAEVDRTLAAAAPLAPCEGVYIARNSKGEALGIASLQTNPVNHGVVWGFRLARKVQLRLLPSVTAYFRYFVNGSQVTVPFYSKIGVIPNYQFHGNIGSSSPYQFRGDSGGPRRRLTVGDRLTISMGFIRTVAVDGKYRVGVGTVKCAVRR